MNNLLSYEQMFESNDAGGYMKILNGIKKVNLGRLLPILDKHTDLIGRLANKYVKDGVILADKIEEDVRNLQFGVTENLDGENDNVIINMLYKFFYKWPKTVVEVIWSFFSEMVIDPLRRGSIWGFVGGSLITIIIAVVIFLFSAWTFYNVDWMFNGIERGRVERVEFVPAHDETRSQIIHDGNSTRTWYYTERVPDGWQIYVSDGNRVEVWLTHSPVLGNRTAVGDSVTNDIGWRWIGTPDR